MKTIAVRELQMHTGRYVREAAEQEYCISHRGRQVAVLRACKEIK